MQKKKNMGGGRQAQQVRELARERPQESTTMRNSAWEQGIQKPETLRDNPRPQPREYNSQHKPQETETGRQKDLKNQRETDRGREKREGRETDGL